MFAAVMLETGISREEWKGASDPGREAEADGSGIIAGKEKSVHKTKPVAVLLVFFHWCDNSPAKNNTGRNQETGITLRSGSFISGSSVLRLSNKNSNRNSALG